MKIYFVRHGHPDYVNDCLTELGHRQASAAAETLKDTGIEQIFSSTNGRALQTAEYTAKALGLGIIPCDFMREIRWSSIDGEPILADGNPWDISTVFVSLGRSLTDKDWRTKEPFCNSRIVDSAETVIKGFDAWLGELGYQSEGDYYRVASKETKKTVAMFSHGGSSSVVISHIFNLPLPQVCGILRPDFTAVTVVEFPDKPGELVCPEFLLANDSRHIKGLDNQISYGN